MNESEHWERDMSDIFRELASQPAWLVCGVALIIGYPVLTVVLGEIGNRLATTGGSMGAYGRPLLLARSSVLPLVFVTLLLRYVAGLDSTHLLVRMVDTALWIIIINSALAFFNVLVFSDQGEDWRSRAPKLLLDLARFFLVMIGAAIVISTVWSVDLGGLLTALGVGSIVIGLALQDTLGSLFSGIALLSARPFKRGDWVEVGGQTGIIDKMSWRSVTLRNALGDLITLPNTTIAKDTITTFAAEGYHGFVVEVSFAYDHPPEVVMAALVEVARATPNVLAEPEPFSMLRRYEDGVIVYGAGLYVDQYVKSFRAKADFLTLLWYMSQRRGLIMPARYDQLYEIPESLVPPVPRTPRDFADEIFKLGALPRQPEKLEPHLRSAKHERYRMGERIITQGKPAHGFLVVRWGREQATLEVDGQPDFAVHEFRQGDFILFKELFRGAPSPFSVVAASDVEAIMVPLEDLLSLLADDTKLGQEIEKLVALREGRASQVLADAHVVGLNGSLAEDRMEILKQMFRT